MTGVIFLMYKETLFYAGKEGPVNIDVNAC